MTNKDVLDQEKYELYGDDGCLAWITDVICTDHYLGKYVGKNPDEKHKSYYWRYEAYPDKYWDIYIDNYTIYAEYRQPYGDEHIFVYEHEYKLEWDYDVDKFYKVPVEEGLTEQEYGADIQTIIVDKVNASTLRELTPK